MKKNKKGRPQTLSADDKYEIWYLNRIKKMTFEEISLIYPCKPNYLCSIARQMDIDMDPIDYLKHTCFALGVTVETEQLPGERFNVIARKQKDFTLMSAEKEISNSHSEVKALLKIFKKW